MWNIYIKKKEYKWLDFWEDDVQWMGLEKDCQNKFTVILDALKWFFFWKGE